MSTLTPRLSLNELSCTGQSLSGGRGRGPCIVMLNGQGQEEQDQQPRALQSLTIHVRGRLSSFRCVVSVMFGKRWHEYASSNWALRWFYSSRLQKRSCTLAKTFQIILSLMHRVTAILNVKFQLELVLFSRLWKLHVHRSPDLIRTT